MEQLWTIHVWDGSTVRHIPRFGTYEAVVRTCAGYPPGYIWSIG